ncbi:MAG: hypothetical protein ACRCV5_06765 [Afipia sp.]
MMPVRSVLAMASIVALTSAAAFAQRGWESYDAGHPVTVEGSILVSTFEDPQATISVKGADKIWTVTLAPVSQMIERGVKADLVAVGKKVSAYGYPSKIEMNEMRAERISMDGKTYELR